MSVQADISIAVLGPQIIRRGGDEIHPHAPQQRRVLAVLASRPGEVIAREVISHHIWGSATAQQLRSLQSYVSHLRTILGTAGVGLSTVDADGNFNWQRQTGKRIAVQFRYDGTRSNTIIIAAR